MRSPLMLAAHDGQASVTLTCGIDTALYGRYSLEQLRPHQIATAIVECKK